MPNKRVEYLTVLWDTNSLRSFGKKSCADYLPDAYSQLRSGSLWIVNEKLNNSNRKNTGTLSLISMVKSRLTRFLRKKTESRLKNLLSVPKHRQMILSQI